MRLHLGSTRKLSKHTQQNGSSAIHAWVDGPYGGNSRRIEDAYNSMILIAGGGGITACLPWTLYIAARVRARTPHMNHVRLIWAVRNEDYIAWAAQEVREVRDIAPEGRVIDLFVTDRQHSVELSTGLRSADNDSSKGGLDRVQDLGAPHRGRPDTATLLPRLITAGRTVVIGIKGPF